MAESKDDLTDTQTDPTDQRHSHQIMQNLSLSPNQYNDEVLPTNTTTLILSEPIQTNHNETGGKPDRAARTRKEVKSNDSAVTRFKWTPEMMQVAMNLLKYGCKPKIVSVAVGCSIRTAQKFAETVMPREEGESYREYEVRRRGRKHKDTNHRLDAIREVLNKDCTKTQVEIAANLKVSNTTVCRDLKKIGGTWRDKKVRTPMNTSIGGNNTDKHD